MVGATLSNLPLSSMPERGQRGTDRNPTTLEYWALQCINKVTFMMLSFIRKVYFWWQ